MTEKYKHSDNVNYKVVKLPKKKKQGKIRYFITLGSS